MSLTANHITDVTLHRTLDFGLHAWCAGSVVTGIVGALWLQAAFEGY